MRNTVQAESNCFLIPRKGGVCKCLERIASLGLVQEDEIAFISLCNVWDIAFCAFLKTITIFSAKNNSCYKERGDWRISESSLRKVRIE